LRENFAVGAGDGGRVADVVVVSARVDRRSIIYASTYGGRLLTLRAEEGGFPCPRGAALEMEPDTHRFDAPS